MSLGKRRISVQGEPAVGLRKAVVYQIGGLGGKADGLGLHSQRAVDVADLVVVGHVPSVGGLEGDRKDILGTAFAHAGDAGLTHRRGGLTVSDLLVGGNGKLVASVGLTVVDPMAVGGGHGNGSLLNRNEGFGHENRVVVRHFLPVSVVDVEEQEVFYAAAIQGTGAFGYRGGMSLDQRGVLRHGELLIDLLLARILQRGVAHVDLHGVFLDRQLTGYQRDGVVGCHVQMAKAHDLDLGNVGYASRVGQRIAEGGDQTVLGAVGMGRQGACTQLVAVKGQGKTVVDAFCVGYRDGDLAGDEFDLDGQGIQRVGVGNIVSLGIGDDDGLDHGGHGRFCLCGVVECENVTTDAVSVDGLCRDGSADR